jgi:sugar phosphate isomerase/epimerase
MLPTRRDVLKLSATAGLSLAAGPLVSHATPAPLAREGKGRIRLSLKAISLGRYFTYNRGKKSEVAADKALDVFKFIDYCASLSVDAEPTTYYFTEDTNEYLMKIRRHAFLRGVSITSAPISNNFSLPKGPERDKDLAHVKHWIDNAAALGAPQVRVFIGQTNAISRDEADKLAIAALEEYGDYAGQKGIFLSIENHDVTNTPARLLSIVKAVKNSWVGINLDLQLDGADQYGDFAKLVPYTTNVHLKSDVVLAGKRGPIDYQRITQILRDGGYRGWVGLKYEQQEDPYVAVPRYLEEMRAALAG